MCSCVSARVSVNDWCKQEKTPNVQLLELIQLLGLLVEGYDMAQGNWPHAQVEEEERAADCAAEEEREEDNQAPVVQRNGAVEHPELCVERARAWEVARCKQAFGDGVHSGHSGLALLHNLRGQLLLEQQKGAPLARRRLEHGRRLLVICKRVLRIAEVEVRQRREAAAAACPRGCVVRLRRADNEARRVDPHAPEG